MLCCEPYPVEFGTGSGLFFLGELPLGLRNNNPGNLRYNSGVNWLGQTGQNYGFVTFQSMAFGYRALMKNLIYYISQGYDTISKIIHRWAPSEDSNNPDSYTQHVSQRTGIGPNQKISPSDVNSLMQIAAAIEVSENGVAPNWNDIYQGAALLGVNSTSSVSKSQLSWFQKSKQWALPAAAMLAGVIIVKQYAKH